MKIIIIITIFFFLFTMQVTLAEEVSPIKEQDIDISDLSEDYWRPNRDELEVVQDRKFNKTGKIEIGLGYGLYQGGEYLNSKSVGASITYHWNNIWATEISTLKINNHESEFLQSVKNRYGFTPDFNAEKRQHTISMLWTPIYAKFSFLGKKISHFETYVGPGVGVTTTANSHFTKTLQIGEKFFITENFIFRIEWKISQYTDQITATQGTPSIANGGPGYFNQSVTKHNIIFGIGWMF